MSTINDAVCAPCAPCATPPPTSCVPFESHVKVVRERDAHKAHRMRLEQEKARLLDDWTRERRKFAAYEPTLVELRQRLTRAVRDRNVFKKERDALRAIAGGANASARVDAKDGSRHGTRRVEALRDVGRVSQCGTTRVVSSVFDANVVLCTRDDGWAIVDASSDDDAGAMATVDSFELCARAAFAASASVVAVNHHGVVCVWDLHQRESVAEFQNAYTHASVCSMDVLALTHDVAIGKSDGTVEIWDVSVDRAVPAREIQAHASSTTHCEWLSCATLLTTGDDDAVKIHDTRCAGSVLEFGARGERHSGGCTTATALDIKDRVRATSSLLATCDGDKKTIMWDMRSRSAIEVIRTARAVKRAASSAAEREIMLAAGDTLTAYDARTGKVKRERKLEGDIVDVTRDSADGRWITASADGVVATWA